MHTLSAPPTVNYQFQLKELRQREDELFKLALANPQEAQLAQFESIWNARSIIHKEIENTMTPMPTEFAKVQESLEQRTYTIEELKAIPRMNMHCSELTEKLGYSLDNRPQLKRGFKLPATIIERYNLTSRQVAILEGKLRITPQVEDVPDRHDNYSEFAREETGYAYTARDIIAGRY